MSELAGLSIAAMQTRQASLARQCTTVADADHVLAGVLASAYSVICGSLHRLNAIVDEVDRAVTDQDQLALNTPMGVHEFERFLVAKQREIVAIVADSHGIGREKTAVLEALRAQYAAPKD